MAAFGEVTAMNNNKCAIVKCIVAIFYSKKDVQVHWIQAETNNATVKVLSSALSPNKPL